MAKNSKRKNDETDYVSRHNSKVLRWVVNILLVVVFTGCTNGYETRVADRNSFSAMEKLKGELDSSKAKSFHYFYKEILIVSEDPRGNAAITAIYGKRFSDVTLGDLLERVESMEE